MQLRNYQTDGVNQLLALKGDMLLADEPGLGKTIMTAEYINKTKPANVLIVCPASLRINWQKELDKWLQHRPMFITITSYEGLKNLVTQKCQYDLTVFDEAHFLKNLKAQRTKNAFLLKTTKKLLLTGTPVVNKPIELYTLLKLMGTKLNRTYFGKRYCNGKLIPIQWANRKPSKYAWDFTGSSNLDELNSQLRKYVMVRRTKAEVLTELPDKTRIIQEVEAVNLESDELENSFNAYFEALAKYSSFTSYNQKIQELRKIAFENLSNERLRLAKQKVAFLVSLVVELLEEEQSLVIFAHHREIIDEISASLKEYGVSKYYGGMTDNQKNQAVEDFQSGKNRVFVGQIRAAGVGLTLTKASTMVFAELDWVPGTIIQCEDRCHRMGQKDNVRVFHLVVKDSIESRLVKALVEKQETIEQIVK